MSGIPELAVELLCEVTQTQTLRRFPLLCRKLALEPGETAAALVCYVRGSIQALGEHQRYVCVCVVSTHTL